MTIPDALSRRPDFKLRTMTISEAYKSFLETGKSGDDEWDEELRTHQDQLSVDDDGEVYHQTVDTEPRVPYVDQWARSDLIDNIHRTYGHCNPATLVDLVGRRGWWPTLRKDCKHYVGHCPQCQLSAKFKDPHREPMRPSYLWDPTMTQPFDRWGLDLIGKLPKTEGGNIWIITAVDYATRWPVARAVPDADAETIARFLLDLYREYGAPREVITDNGPNLWAPAMERAFELLRTRHRGTTIYHPRTNGVVERYNGVLGLIMTKYLADKKRTDWDKYLDQALFATRIRTHTTTGFSPFYLLYGVHPRLVGDQAGPAPMDLTPREDPKPLLDKDRALALQRTEERSKQNASAWENTLNHKTKFKEGDWVLITTKQPNKWESHWYGPYKISAVKLFGTYELKSPSGRTFWQLVHGDRMIPCRIQGRVTRG